MRLFLKKQYLPILLLLCSHFSAMAAQDIKLSGKGYDQHVELNWSALPDSDMEYFIRLSLDGKEWIDRAVVSEPYLMDFVGEFGNNLTLTYRLYSLKNGVEDFLEDITLKTRTFSDDELVEMVQKYTFRYFWDFAEEKSGFARERTPNNDADVITTGGTGFGIMSVITGAERGWISREDAVDRLLILTKSLKRLKRFHGMWAHWYDAKTEKVFHFSKYDDGGDIIESAFMAQGLLTARQYFDKDTAKEKRLRHEITQLWEQMEWNWYTNGENVLKWHWSEKYKWKMNLNITGYSEALIVYILAASSPTHAISANVYHEGWANSNTGYFQNYDSYYGMSLPLGSKHDMGGPLFFSHYSFLGLDPRGLSDQYANYWEQGRRHTLINRAYAIDNPKGWKGYGNDFWGLTAGDGVPSGYNASSPGERDMGTIGPTAALSSMPYAPEASLAVLKNLYYNHGKELFGPMGFYDGINLSVSDVPAEQVVKTYLAIDQGPIVAMIENYRTGLLWKYFMKDPDVRRGLDKLEFSINGQKIQ